MDNETSWRMWDLSGLKVTQLRFDFRFSVHLWTLERDLLVVFGTPFELVPPNGEVRRINPEDKAALGPLLQLLHLPAKTFAASAAGSCAFDFEDGTQLRAEPHEQFEAWESQGSGDLSEASLLCGSGGGSPWG